jgi:hypothetical protein
MKTSILTLAIALAFSFTAAPADAKLTEGQKCAMKANLLSGKFSLCLNKADANVSKDKADDTAAADAKCETKFRTGWDKTRDKAKEKDASLGADCGGAMSDAVRDSVEASALIAAGTGRDLAAFAVSEDDLDDDSGIKSLVFDLTYEWTLDAYGDGCEAAGGSWESGASCTAADITSNDAGIAAAAGQTACVEAGGTWESGTCRRPIPYPCAIAAMCSEFATQYPEALPYYTNNYTGDTAATSGCSQGSWDSATTAAAEAFVAFEAGSAVLFNTETPLAIFAYGLPSHMCDAAFLSN